MRKADSKGPSDRGRTHPPARRSHDKATAMRESVRKAIESLIENKGPRKGPRHTCLLIGALLSLAASIANLQ